jgi:hypothetical protein
MPFQPPGETRAEAIAAKAPQLVADVWLYPAANGGKGQTAEPGWGRPCFCSKSTNTICYDGWPILHEPLAPGDRRRVGFVFLHEEQAVEALRRAGTFYLREGRFLGEALVVADN